MINIYWNIDLVEYKKMQKEVDYTASGYPEIIDVVGDLTVEINNKKFFEQPYFPVIEFIRTLEQWDKNSDMLYNCIETEDNPLISFIYDIKGWKIKSPWQLFECTLYFQKKELLESIEKLMKSVKEQLERGRG